MQFLTNKLGAAILQSCILASYGCALDGAYQWAGPQKTRASQIDQYSCIETVEEYINKTRGWSRNLYTLTEERATSKGREFSIIYKDDLNVFFPEGGLRSFHLELSPSCSKVISELAYQ